MKKVKLQNMQSMSQLTSHGPLDRSLNLNENGMLNDSGVIDESGIIGQIFRGIDYSMVGVNAIQVRYVCVWTRTMESYYGNISLDDGSDPDASGCLGDPIINNDSDLYQFVNQSIDETGTSGSGTITASWSLFYKSRRRNPWTHEYEPWEDRFASGTMNFVVPSYQDLIDQQQEQSGFV